MIERPDSLSQEVWESVTDSARLQVLAALQVLDTDADPDFDRLTRIAGSMFEAPIVLVSLIDRERQWFKSSVGFDRAETPIEMSFCAHAIAEKSLPALVIPDASTDARFVRNPLVTGSPLVRFYAGAPVTVHGQRIGALGVISPVARAGVDQRLITQLVDLAGAVGSLFELKDEARVRARTAAELIKEEWRHALTLEAGKVGSWVWDLRSKEIVANDIFRSMFGLNPVGAIHADDMFAAIDAADRPVVQSALDITFDEGADYVAEFRARSGRWLIGRGRVYQRDSAGKPLIMMGVNIDITEARQAADQTRLLLRELNHRVKNTLAMIQSLARQSLRQAPDPQHFIESFSGRLRTFSDAHTLLADRDWSGIGLIELIHSQVGPFLLTSPQQLLLMGADVHLSPDHSLGLGLILHELASNAVKYGALSQAGGVVDVSWTEGKGPGRRIDLIWKERDGPRVHKPRQRGFGSKLIERSLDKVLESKVTLTYPEDGVEAKISFPV